MTEYWKKQMDHGPTAHYYAALTRMVSVLKKDGHKVNKVLEIGTGWGISGTVFLEAECDQLWTVDPNMDQPYVQESIKQLKRVQKKSQAITFIRKSSHELETVEILRGQRFDMIFIDGRHDYESVKDDLMIAIRRLGERGVIICDDYTHPKNGGEYGVAQAVTEFMEDATDVQLIEDLTGNGLAAIIHT